MKRVIILLAIPFIFISCIDKKVEEQKKKDEQIHQQIQEIEKIADESIEVLTKESDAIESALNELDNL